MKLWVQSPCADVDIVVYGARSTHIPVVSLEDKYLTSHVYPTLPMEPPTCYSVTNRICNLVTTSSRAMSAAPLLLPHTYLDVPAAAEAAAFVHGLCLLG